MTVTDIVEVNKSKAKVYIDHEFAFVLYKGEIYKHQIKKDREISQDVYQLLCEEVLPKRVKLRAMNLLTKRPYTEAKLRQKLREGFYTENLIDIAIDYVKSFGYIDDASYARDYIVYHAHSMSRKQMEQKLLEKKIQKDVISRILDEELKEQEADLEAEQIRQLFQKKYKGVLPTEREQYIKMMQFFMRKGYSASGIKKIVGDLDSLDDLYN